MQNAISWKTEDIFFHKLLSKIEQLGLDCNRFRRSYIERRLAGRLRATGCRDYLCYSRYLDKHPEEYPVLLDALTVNVTEFFRDTPVYHELETNIFPAIVAANANRGRIIRLWSAGCASGEETFSMALIVARCLEQLGTNLCCSIYGTDIDTASISTAKQGAYPLTALETIPERYHKYLVPQGSSHFSFAPKILQMVRFKKLDLFVDKPLKQVEVVLCRNVMIYFEREQQEELIGHFYRALVTGGYLTIGKSEKLQYRRDAFSTVNAGCRIYRKLDV
jgi:chemotaxis protein methyltransferase CheR